MLVHRQGIVSALVSFQKEAVGSEQPSRTCRDPFTNGGFARSGNSHENHCFWRIIWHNGIEHYPERHNGSNRGAWTQRLYSGD